MNAKRSLQNAVQLAVALLVLAGAGCSKIEDAFADFLPVVGGGGLAPRVISSLPTPGQRGVPKDSPVVLTFNKPIDEQKCIGAFSVQPPLPGVFDFAGQVMTFTSSRQFRGGETYIITLNQDCEDAEGVDLEETYFASFSTSIELSPPFLANAAGRKNATGCLPGDPFEQIYPNTGTNSVDLCRPTPIVMNFNESMDRGSVERSINVIPNIVGAFVWSNLDSTVEFRPRDQLENGITYVVNIAETARDVAENQMTDPVTFSFTVGNESERPLVVMQNGTVNTGTGCTPGTPAIIVDPVNGLRNRNGVCSSQIPGNVNSQVIIDFSEDMDIGTVDAAFNVSPPINGNKVWSSSGANCGITTGSCAANNSRLTFTPIQPWQNATTYTVSIGSNAADAAGNLMATNHVFSFTIGTDPNLPRVLMQDGRVENGGNCTAGGNTTAFAVDPVFGLRNKTGVCTSSIAGDQNSPIIIDFNEDMDIGATDGAFNVSPPINGSKGWSNSAFCNPAAGTCVANSNRLTFTPNQPWQTGVTYTVSIGGSARDAAGNNMGAPHVFSFTTGLDPEPPNVVNQNGQIGGVGGDCSAGGFVWALVADPINGLRNQTGVCSSNVAGNVNSPVIIDFSEDMDIGTTDGAFNISPPLNGSKAWSAAPGCGTTLGTCTANTSRLTFTPIQPWANATTYTVNVQSSARDAAGLNLPASYSFSFTIGNDVVPPTVTSLQGDVLGDCDADGESTLANLDTNLCFLGGQQRLRVNFSEAMDPPVTAGAFSISPSVSGGLNWLPAGCQLLNPTTCTSLEFLPTQALTLNQQYQITIASAAQDISGNRLAVPYILYATTGDGTPPDVVAPTVVDLTADRIGVACDGNGSESIAAGFVNNVCTDNGGTGSGAVVVVQFSEAMDQALTASAFSITPSVSGVITFAGNNLVFTATQALNPGTQYKVTVGAGARDLQGNALATSYVRFFDTTAVGGYPGVTSINIGTGVAPCTGGAAANMLVANITNACQNSNPIEVTFTEPMNQAVTQSAFSVSPNLDGVFSWPAANTLRFTPDRAIDPNRRYDVSLSTSAQDAQGHSLQTAVTGSFIAGGLDATPPTVVQVRFEQPNAGADACVAPPNDAVVGAGSLTADVCRATPIEIQFSEPMDQGATASATNVTSATFAVSWPAANVMRITPLGSGFDSGSAHNLTVSTGAKDLGGNGLTLQFALSFVAEDTSPRIDAIGLESQGTWCDSFGDTGQAAGVVLATDNTCWWDASLPIRSATNYRFVGEDSLCGFDGPRDNIRIIFNKPMDTGATLNAVRLRRLSPPIHTIQLGKADWSADRRVLTVSFAAQEAANCGGATQFGGGDFDLGSTTGAGIGFPLYSIEVERSARDETGEALPASFFFAFEGD